MRFTVNVYRGPYAGKQYTFHSAAAARRKRDRLDLQYGASCATVRGDAESVHSEL